MNDHELIDWLLQYGGPIIQYRTATELLDSNTGIDIEKITRKLIDNDKVKKLLERFNDYEHVSGYHFYSFNSIHSATGLEGIIARLLEYGLKSGLPVFDSKMHRLKQFIANKHVSDALSPTNKNDIIGYRAIFLGTLAVSYLFRGGYYYEEAVEYAIKRLKLLNMVVTRKVFDIYLDDNELIHNSRRPKRWDDIPVIQPRHNPGSSEMPLPGIHDIFALAYFPKRYADDEITKQILDIVDYVLDQRFQKLHPMYGLLWYESSKVYHLCNWKPEIPCLDMFDNMYQRNTLLLYMDLMSHFSNIRQSQWFHNCLLFLEQFKTSDGTYIFPPEYLKDVNGGVYVCGQAMGLGENRRSKISYELESTFRMLLIKKRIHNS